MSVSVVVPCFNRETLLPRAIRSALDQSVPPAEVIVIDDGSKDGSAAVAREFGSPVRVIKQANAGAAAARNRGIEAATGDWIAFLDSDDIWHPDKLQWQFRTAERFPEADLIFCDTVVKALHGDAVRLPSRFAEGGLYAEEAALDPPFALYDRSLFTRMVRQSRVITSAVMVRRTLPELRFPEHIWGSEDWALWLRLALRYPFASVDKILVTMFAGDDNLTGQKGKLYRNDVRVLEDLLADPALTPAMAEAVREAIPDRRFGAAYFSLVGGDGRGTREMLHDFSAVNGPRTKLWLYWLASFAPGSLLRKIAGWR